MSCSATDTAGNEDPTPAKTIFLVDQTKPTISLSKPAMRERFPMLAPEPAMTTPCYVPAVRHPALRTTHEVTD